MMDYEQIKAIIEARLKQWERALGSAEAARADMTVTVAFEAGAVAARIILQDLETAYGILEAQKAQNESVKAEDTARRRTQGAKDGWEIRRGKKSAKGGE